MPPDPRRTAQQRADQVRAFRRELDEVEAAGVLSLTPEQREAVTGYHDGVLAELSRAYDVDRSTRGGQLSRGLRIASLLGAASLVAAITALVQRVWGQLGLATQITLLTAFPLAALACVQIAAERERTKYVAGIFALVACGTAWFGIYMAASVLDLPMSDLLLWPGAAFALAVAVSYGFRLVFALSLAAFAVAASSAFFSAAGVPWPTVFERLEPLTATAFVLIVFAAHFGRLGPGFEDTARVTGLIIGLGALLILSNARGASLLAFSPATAEVVYQVLFVPVAVLLLWQGLRRAETTAASVVAGSLGIYLVIRYADWFWDRLPAWAFFLVLSVLAFGCIALLSRARRRAEAA